jgi:predicted DNA-binding transcriptional regulator AlpA
MSDVEKLKNVLMEKLKNPLAEKLRITLTEREFCEAVGISRITAWRLREAGKLPHCRIGNKVIYLPRHVDEFLASCEQVSRSAARARHA